ncbi:MAG: hypothetical protein OXH73_09280 [Caldilineaceae bacterium]|nr:hypothetical protein [Caldilineaceae bacterium]
MKKITICILALIASTLSACAPIPPKPPQEPVCHDGFVAISVEQIATDPLSSDLPGHIDIAMIETHLNGDTLTATFHLKGLPETLGINREGMPFFTFEYFYTVNINIDGGPIYQNHLSDYTLAAFYQAQNMAPSSIPPQNILHAVLWRNRIDKNEITIYFDEVPGYVGLEISHLDDTLTMTAQVPGISQDSTVLFMAEDYLAGTDGGSCEPY